MNTPMQILIDQLKDLYNYDLSEGKRNWTILAGIELAQALLEKEKEVAQQYAEFAIECDRKELPVLEFDGWINL